jgi:hypothetical protein
LAAELQNFQSNQSLTLTNLERKMHLTISSLDATFEISENRTNSSLTRLHQLVDRHRERGILAQFDIYVFITNKGNNKITELRRKVKTHKYINRQISQQPENRENRNDPGLVQAFLQKWWVESDFKAPNDHTTHYY